MNREPKLLAEVEECYAKQPRIILDRFGATLIFTPIAANEVFTDDNSIVGGWGEFGLAIGIHQRCGRSFRSDSKSEWLHGSIFLRDYSPAYQLLLCDGCFGRWFIEANHTQTIGQMRQWFESQFCKNQSENPDLSRSSKAVA